MNRLLDYIMRGGAYKADFTPHNNRKWTRGRQYRFAQQANGKVAKVWVNRD